MFGRLFQNLTPAQTPHGREASLKVTSFLVYQGSQRGWIRTCRHSRAKIRLTRLNNPSRQGAVRSTLLADQFRGLASQYGMNG